MGKHQLNLTDPAYDLADVILHWNLSPEQELELLATYAEVAGDPEVAGRMLLHKVLAGNWSMERALENLNDPNMLPRHQEFNRQYIQAWNFLVSHTIRFCGARLGKPEVVRWGSPLAVLDIDGVIDKNVFGYPGPTAASMQAMALLHAHGMPIALDTARSVAEVKEYCRAYGCVGGVAEYGAHVWDAISDGEQVLVSEESLDEIARLRAALRQIPGVFLNDDYLYSIRAYTYDQGRTVALPKVLVQDLLAQLQLDRLAVHHTFLDTAIVASETDKGRGLLELLRLAGVSHAETYAVGDSAPDLPMFRAASRSFAPGHIGCSAAAKLLGCRVAGRAWQPGLLQCVRAIVHPRGDTCGRCRPVKASGSPQERYFLKLLDVADRSALASLVRAMVDPMALQTFLAD